MQSLSGKIPPPSLCFQKTDWDNHPISNEQALGVQTLR